MSCKGCTAAILAGGHSKRMGQPKHSIRLRNGCTMIETIASRIASICDRIIIVGPNDVLPTYLHVQDQRDNCGPLGGIEALLASGIAASYVVLPCDQPLIDATILRALTSATMHPMTAVRIAGRPDVEPLPVRISAAALPSVRELLDSGARSMRACIDRVEHEIVELSPSAAGQLTNVNTPADLDAVQRDPVLDESRPQPL